MAVDGTARLGYNIRFLDAYLDRQTHSPTGAVLNPIFFHTLAGTGKVRLGSGFTAAERRDLDWLGRERSRRQALKREFGIAHKLGRYAENPEITEALLEGDFGAASRLAALAYSTDLQSDAYDRRTVDDQVTAGTGSAIGGAGAVAGGILGAQVGSSLAGITGAGSSIIGTSAAVGAGVGLGIGALIAAPIIGVLVGISLHQKAQAKKKKRKMRAIGAASRLTSNYRGFTPTGALLSREGEARIARSYARNQAKKAAASRDN